MRILLTRRQACVNCSASSSVTSSASVAAAWADGFLDALLMSNDSISPCVVSLCFRPALIRQRIFLTDNLPRVVGVDCPLIGEDIAVKIGFLRLFIRSRLTFLLRALNLLKALHQRGILAPQYLIAKFLAARTG